MLSYTLYDGKSYRSVRGLAQALERGKSWSIETGKVVSVLNGSTTHTYIYRGREITGKEAESIWIDEEVYEVDTDTDALVM